MTGKSHAIIGAITGYFLGGPTAIPFSIAGALLTDIDEPNSKISRMIFPKGTYSKKGRIFLGGLLLGIGVYMKLNYLILLGLGILGLAFIPHRGILHSPAFLALLIYFVIQQYGYKSIFIYICIGYASHILADAFTDRGIPLFYPISSKKYGLGFIKTGSLSEYLFLTVLILGVYIYYAY